MRNEVVHQELEISSLCYKISECRINWLQHRERVKDKLPSKLSSTLGKMPSGRQWKRWLKLIGRTGDIIV